MNRRKILWAAIFSLLVSVGCVGVLPFVVGAGAGAGGYAWYRGYLKKSYHADVPTAAMATEKALKDMGFAVESSKVDRFSARIKGTRATGEKFIVALDRDEKTDLTDVKVRVGIPGNPQLAEEVHTEIQRLIS